MISAGLMKQREWKIGTEVVLVGVFLSAWLVSWFSLDDSLSSLAPAGRALFLVNQFTSENLAVALALGVGVVMALPLRLTNPKVALVVVASLAVVLQWMFPLLVATSIVMRLSLGVAIFWVTWTVPKWWGWVALGLVPYLIAHGVRAFQVNLRYEAINSTPSTTPLSVSSVMQEALLFAAIIIGGLAMRRIAEQRAELEERNRELVTERARASQAAVLDERLRISRELHDVVAHHVTTMTVHAGAARQLVEGSPEKATESLLHIESAGRDAVGELHQLLGFLRNSDDVDNSAGDRSPTPSLRHLSSLAESFGSKLTCAVTIDGDLTSVPGAVDVSAYRIIQEALTNALKHSTAKSADIHLVAAAKSLTLSVTNTGSPRHVRANKTAPGGHGLVGMRERASLHGGEVEAGPIESGEGWQVRAVLPFGGTS